LIEKIMIILKGAGLFAVFEVR